MRLRFLWAFYVYFTFFASIYFLSEATVSERIISPGAIDALKESIIGLFERTFDFMAHFGLFVFVAFIAFLYRKNFFGNEKKGRILLKVGLILAVGCAAVQGVSLFNVYWVR
jgi:hypothetical protein